jgi:hypothetical protein
VLLITSSLKNFLISQPGEPSEGVRNSTGQPVEQLGMRRQLAADAEVARRADDARAEQLLPEAVER